MHGPGRVPGLRGAWATRLAAEGIPKKRLSRGVGWTPTNVQINCFDRIADSPFGALGDLLLVPDPSAEVRVDFGEVTERFALGDILTLESEPWEFCTRSLLKSALDRLDQVAGVRLLAAFEHEFQLTTATDLKGEAYGRGVFEAQRTLCETLISKIESAGLVPDSVMKEYGPNQYEIVIGPEEGVRAADAAIILRELTRSTARHLGQRATFTPIRDPESVGNGVHIHMSFLGANGQPVSYDEAGSCGMSALAASFAAGVPKYLNAIIAFTAPSVISYLRLTPHRWSAAYNNLGFRDREVSQRICPVTAKDTSSVAWQFNIEFRTSDAAACPHLALAAIVHAGVQAIAEQLAAPDPTEEDLSLLPAGDLAARGLVRLPETLEAALDLMGESTTVASWFPATFLPVYKAHKDSEISHLAEMDIPARCAAYERTY